MHSFTQGTLVRQLPGLTEHLSAAVIDIGLGLVSRAHDVSL